LPRGTFPHHLSGAIVVAQIPEQIDAKVQQIYGLASQSENPISVMCLQCTFLLARDDWTPNEVERVSSEVLTMLIRHGWKMPGTS
jgi:hypothetical protein